MTAEQIKMLNELLELEDGLNDFEVEFVDNLDQNWRTRNLSIKQNNKLIEIAERHLNE